MKSEKITIADVAQRAGCSKATVSYVINRTRPISEAMRNLVMDAIEELHYRPSGLRQIKRERRVIALLINSNLDVASLSVIPAVSNAVIAAGYEPQAYLCPSNYKITRNTMTGIYSERHVAGIINLRPDVVSVDLLKWGKEIPSVIYARDNCMLCPVQINYPRRMQLAIEHLVRLGHRRIGYVIDAETVNRPLQKLCLETFSHYRLTDGSLLHGDVVAHPNERDNPSFFLKMDKLLESGCRALIAWNGFFATIVYQYCWARKLRIPDDLSVVGFADEQAANSLAPEMTTVSMPLKLLAQYTVEALISRIENHPFQEVKLSPQLVRRKSTAAPPLH